MPDNPLDVINLVLAQAQAATALKEETDRFLSSQVGLEWVRNCIAVHDVKTKGDDITLFNSVDGRQSEVSKYSLKALLGHEFDAFMRNRSKPATFTYDPRPAARVLSFDPHTRFLIYNTFNPPEWRKQNFYFNEPIDRAPANLPPLLHDFFMHLVKGHKPSYEYMLDWMANSLHERNLTFLVAIGKQGVGKGLLGSLLSKLHGASNFSYTNDSVFKNRFNAPLINKTLIYVDEVELKDKEHQDRMKMVVNDKFLSEKKGRDAVEVFNYASFYLSSNHFDAIEVTNDDRRFSIIELTDVKANKVFSAAERDRIAGNDPKLVQALALYLFNRKIYRDMSVPFTESERYEEVKEERLSDWDHYMVEVWSRKHAGKPRVNVQDVSKELEEKFKQVRRIGRRRLDRMARDMSDLFKMHKPKGDLYFLESLRAPEPTSSQVQKLLSDAKELVENASFTLDNETKKE